MLRRAVIEDRTVVFENETILPKSYFDNYYHINVPDYLDAEFYKSHFQNWFKKLIRENPESLYGYHTVTFWHYYFHPEVSIDMLLHFKYTYCHA